MAETIDPRRTPGDSLVDAILSFLSSGDLLSVEDIRAALMREIDEAGPDGLVALRTRLGEDNGWDYHARDQLAQRIHHLLADRFVTRGSELLGIQHLSVIENAPVVLAANHLSYADANVVEVLLQWAGCHTLANRLTTLAGPKVFASRERRFSSLCFGTIKVPQSADVASGEAVLSEREVARAAMQSIHVALDRLQGGDALLLFGEGTRSRTGELQQMLAGVARYLALPDVWVLPVGLTGSEALFPVGANAPRAARVTVHLGTPLRADALSAGAKGDRRLIVDAIGLAIAQLLPDSYRGVYRDAAAFPRAAPLAHEAKHSA